MIAKQLAETALLLWTRMGERSVAEKTAILKTLANWLELEGLEASRPGLNAQMNNAAPPITDEHYRA